MAGVFNVSTLLGGDSPLWEGYELPADSTPGGQGSAGRGKLRSRVSDARSCDLHDGDRVQAAAHDTGIFRERTIRPPDERTQLGIQVDVVGQKPGRRRCHDPAEPCEAALELVP